MRLKSRKKGAYDASAAAALIAIIAALTILYILFIPPEERQKILEENDYTEVSKENEDLLTLLSESPKRLLPIETKEFEQDLPTVYLRLGEEGVKIKTVDSIYAQRSLFKSIEGNLTFNIEDLGNVKNTLLNFYVANGKGRLLITVNGEQVFNRELERGNIQPINIKEKLQTGKNRIIFEVSSPGALFWRTNKYALEDILITADMITRDAQESELTFVISSQERDNLERIKLRFFPDCETGTVGALSIWINNENLYSGVPDCGVVNRPIEFLPEKLVVGLNRLIFRTAAGSYLIDNIKLTSDLKEMIVPIYYFEIDEEDFGKVQDKEANVTLFMKFVDDTERKTADILVNNHAIRLDQKEIEFNESITKLVEEGNNAIKIEPDDILDIVRLEVKLEE